MSLCNRFRFLSGACESVVETLPIVTSYLTLVALLIVTGTLVYWSIFDTRPKIWSSNVRTFSGSDDISSAFRPGQVVYIERDFCATETMPALVSRRWTSADGKLIFLGTSGEQIVEQGCSTLRNPVVLPVIMPPGRYFYHTSASYDQNPLRRATVLFPLAEIVVTNWDGR
jgi:hypothetical protein